HSLTIPLGWIVLLLMGLEVRGPDGLMKWRAGGSWTNSMKRKDTWPQVVRGIRNRPCSGSRQQCWRKRRSDLTKEFNYLLSLIAPHIYLPFSFLLPLSNFLFTFQNYV